MVLECKFCKNTSIIKVIDLGLQPIANNLITNEQLSQKEPYYPLEAFFCTNCNLLQLLHNISPDEMFKQYFYITSQTKTFHDHFIEYAETVAAKMNLKKDSLVVEIGSNVGTLLKKFQSFGVQTLGVDPATNIVKLAQANDVKTICDYFTEEVATKILREKGKTAVIICNNTFSQVYDWDELMRAVNILLDEYGIFVIEVPYLVDLLANTEFDTIYHEHHGYFAIKPFTIFVKRFGMEVFDVERKSVHGGSIRIFVRKHLSSNPKAAESVNELLKLEQRLKLDKPDTYKEFNSKIQVIKKKLIDLLSTIKEQKKRIVGYGAPAKATVLTNYCGIGSNILDYTVDKNQLKQDKYIPGSRILIASEEKFHEDNPDYALVFAWNFFIEIFEKEKEFLRKGGKFIVPIPEPKIAERPEDLKLHVSL